MGGEATRGDQSRAGKLSSWGSTSTACLFSPPSKPENMVFSGVCSSMSVLPGLLMTLHDDESGGVDGYVLSSACGSASYSMAGLDGSG